MITAHRALSIRRRGSSSSGKKLPVRSLGILTSRSPAGVDTSLGRCPLRWVVRVRVRSWGSAPIRAVTSASTSSWMASARISANDAPNGDCVSVRRVAELGQGRLIVGHRAIPLSWLALLRIARWPPHPEDPGWSGRPTPPHGTHPHPRPVALDGSSAAASCPFNESARGCLIETRPVRPGYVASTSRRFALAIRDHDGRRGGPRSGALRRRNSICG